MTSGVTNFLPRPCVRAQCPAGAQAGDELTTQTLPADEWRSADALLRQLDFHRAELGDVERDIAIDAIDDPVVARLMTVPGDVTVAISIVAAVGDFSRFDDPNKLRIKDEPRLTLEECATRIASGDAAVAQFARMSTALRSPGHRKAKSRSKAVTVPARRPFPPVFYERVSTLYSEVAAKAPRPAAVIAEASGVPVTTVHSWIKECRQRELLPAGRAGKAG